MTEFANRLIRATIENARRIPFYEKLWSGVDVESIQHTRDLRRLPLLHKPKAVEFLRTFDYRETPALLSHSSGTTTGEITVRCRSQRELQAMWDLFKGQEAWDDSQELPLILNIACANHGQPVPLPGRGFGLAAVGFDRDVIEHVVQQLTRTYHFPGVSSRVEAIHSSLGFLKMLTLELIERGIPPASLGMKCLVTFGEHLTDAWAERLMRIWNAELVDRYSCSETIGGARRCSDCGWLTFDPLSFPEAVDPVTEQPIEDGVGLLVLTELYPYSDLQPLIRFIPGDLVRIRQTTCKGTAVPTFRFLGRHDFCLQDRDCNPPELILFSAEVASVLDGFHELAREREFHSLRTDEASQDLPAPLATTRLVPAGDRRRIEVVVVPKFSIATFPEAAARLRRRIHRALLRECTGLTERLKSGKYDLDVELCQNRAGFKGYRGS